MAEYLGMFSFGGLYQKDHFFKKYSVLKRPEKLYDKAGYEDVPYVNDIPYMSGSMANYIIGDTPKQEKNKLQWHKIQDGERTLLISDRNILTYVSWNDLNEQGYIFGKNIMMDGVPYLCRVLTGGNGLQKCEYDPPQNNEWDRFIHGMESIAGIPKPKWIPIPTNDDTKIDLEGIPSFPKHLIDRKPLTAIEDRMAENNRFWNWSDCSSWCQEAAGMEKDAPRVYRGYVSSGSINYANPFSRHTLIGFRPVLEF